MIRVLMRSPMVVATAALAAASLGGAAWSVRRAAQVPSIVLPAAVPPRVRAVTSSKDHRPSVDIVAAVETDPFHPDRRRPTARYRVPGEVVIAPADADAATTGLALLGTVVAVGGGGFAMCQLGKDTPRVVRIGQTIGPLTLRRVAQGRALFLAASGDSVTLTVPKPGAP